ncbi:MAG: hypothetical protein BGO05_10490 [Rhizobiales bacterium 63-7]|uniref:YqaA family protein n=1 Tax=Rhizobium sp. YJ-22 TaxID=3037556 RepID=UPI00092CDB45|nr:YqaA family protein [Rhizobium sp. YJ-22]MBN9034192.1 DedA family protein [Hyphomicrobiales bacterium]MBN9052852.1 DedA family protein [Hyphomicrobiales bacterium]MDG3580310.1 DedA family protein [Rhizobium sp. YJ-22]OJU66436.1 MAG: hypothetical protein BGO05_10490 [Rhizobiales bacterium 63-7]
MLNNLYKWVLSLANRPTAPAWLAFIAFVESSIFLVPADALLLPMLLARPERSYRYALIATVASVAGGIAGWALGYFAYDAIAKPILGFYGKLAEFEHLKASVNGWWIMLMMTTSGIAHLPPIKLVTILSGVVHLSLPIFIALATVTRGARFFLLAYLLRRFGERVGLFIERRLNQIAVLVLVMAIFVFLVSRCTIR